MTGTIYRRVSKPPNPITNGDFYSGKEAGRDRRTDRMCQRWGTSVWVGIDDLSHDIEAVTYLHEYRFVSVDITEEHGVILKTDSASIQNHHTFWRDHKIDFGEICELIYEPVP